MPGKNALDLITTDVKVGIDEVVAIFVSRYETELFGKKDALSDQIKKLKAQQAKIVADAAKLVDKSEYEIAVPKLGITFKVDAIEVILEKREHYREDKVGIHISVGMWDKDESRTYASHTKRVFMAIDKKVVAEHKAIGEEIERLNTELLEVMGLIKSVSRKERQIRGRIAEMKLEQAGKADLLSNTELTKLITMG